MTTFDDRERAYETKFARDEEHAFKVVARRNKALGLWAGQLLGKDGQELDAYVREVMRADLLEAGDEDVLRKVSADLQGRAEPAEVRAQMESLLATAQAQLDEGR